jgi:hypothetical protein
MTAGWSVFLEPGRVPDASAWNAALHARALRIRLPEDFAPSAEGGVLRATRDGAAVPFALTLAAARLHDESPERRSRLKGLSLRARLEPEPGTPRNAVLAVAGTLAAVSGGLVMDDATGELLEGEAAVRLARLQDGASSVRPAAAARSAGGAGYVALAKLGWVVVAIAALSLVDDVKKLAGGRTADLASDAGFTLALAVVGLLAVVGGRARHRGWWLGLLSAPFLAAGIVFAGTGVDAARAGETGPAVMGVVLGGLLLAAAATLLAGAAWWERRAASRR